MVGLLLCKTIAGPGPRWTEPWVDFSGAPSGFPVGYTWTSRGLVDRRRGFRWPMCGQTVASLWTNLWKIEPVGAPRRTETMRSCGQPVPGLPARAARSCARRDEETKPARNRPRERAMRPATTRLVPGSETPTHPGLGPAKAKRHAAGYYTSSSWLGSRYPSRASDGQGQTAMQPVTTCLVPGSETPAARASDRPKATGMTASYYTSSSSLRGPAWRRLERRRERRREPNGGAHP